MLSHPNCKINIGLHIVSRRPDGYHNLETIFYPIRALCDDLEIVPLCEGGDTNDGYVPVAAFPDSLFCVEGVPVAGDVNDNLVVKAYCLLRRIFPSRVGAVTIRLVKKIPLGAGLGGGSADAAFALSMLNELFQLGLSVTELKKYALSLGADCPFFIDNEPSYATGIGEELSSLKLDLSSWSLLLVKPDLAISTAEAYAGVVPRSRRADVCPVVLPEEVRNPVEQWKGSVVNDFETSLFPKYPVLSHIKTSLYELGACYASMSGSGATVFGLFPAAARPDFAYFNHFDDVFVCWVESGRL